MRANGQKYDGIIRQVFTKTIVALRNMSTFFTDDKNDSKVSINTTTPASFQIQSSTDITKKFGVHVWILQYAFYTPFDPLS